MKQSHKEKLSALLAEMGITPLPSDSPANAWSRENIIVLHEGHGNVEGYAGFFCLFVFNEDDSLEKVEIGE